MNSIRLQEHCGSFLKTRFLGEQLRSEILTAIREGGELQVDFEGVTGITHSFADECFGDIFSESGAELFRTRLHLTGLNDSCRSVLRLVFADRNSRKVA